MSTHLFCNEHSHILPRSALDEKKKNFVSGMLFIGLVDGSTLELFVQEILQPTLSDLSVLCGKLWLIAASEAWSKSLIDLFILSMASSHSFWPGALSL